jgi:voltage-gated sodium channel
MSDVELKRLLSEPGLPPWRRKLAIAIESHFIQHLITIVIFVNAVILGVETHTPTLEKYGPILRIIDKTCLSLFCIELVLKMIAFRSHFWRGGWNVFDFIVVSVSLIPDSGGLSVMRALKVFRVLRLLSVVSPLRRVTGAFFNAIPGIISVVGVMLVFFYTSGVVASFLFGQNFPEWFGHIGKSLYTLFQIMTLEGWSMDIVRPVMTVYPMAWAFFVPFVIIATFTIMNLFVGVIVAAMSDWREATGPTPGEQRIISKLAKLEAEILALRQERNAMRSQSESAPAQPAQVPDTDGEITDFETPFSTASVPKPLNN